MGKPLLFPDDALTELDRFDPAVVEMVDGSYIPGYSEAVMANDLAKADPLIFREMHRTAPPGGRTQEDYFKRLGTGPSDLPVEFQWLRVVGINGSNSHSADLELANWKRQGFRPATEEDLRTLGYGFPPAAHKEADGSIRRADTQLFIRSGEVARRWERYRAEQARAAENAPKTETRQVEVIGEEREQRYLTSKE